MSFMSFKELVWSALALWVAIALAGSAALAASSGEPNEEPAAFRDFCLAANKQLEVFLNDIELKCAAAVFKMMVKAGERVHAKAQETGLNFHEMGERPFLGDWEQFETREKVPALCPQVRMKLLWKLNEEWRPYKDAAAASGITIATVGCTATQRVFRVLEACMWYDSRGKSKREKPSEADGRARHERAGFEEFCLKAHSVIETFVSHSSRRPMDEKVRAMRNGIMIGAKVRAITESTGRNANEIDDIEFDWPIGNIGVSFPIFCGDLERVQPMLNERLNEALEKQKTALQARGQSPDSLADITLENVGCEATHDLVLFQKGCHWWHNKKGDRRFESSPFSQPKYEPQLSRPDKRRKRKESRG